MREKADEGKADGRAGGRAGGRASGEEGRGAAAEKGTRAKKNSLSRSSSSLLSSTTRTTTHSEGLISMSKRVGGLWMNCFFCMSHGKEGVVSTRHVIRLFFSSRGHRVVFERASSPSIMSSTFVAFLQMSLHSRVLFLPVKRAY